jgi:hypothetical protein
VARYLETATLLNNGQVLMAGGWNAAYQVLASTESYDPGSGTFTVTASLGTGRQGHAAALLNNGTVMVTGGWDANSNTLASTEIYDPVAGTFSPTGGLNTPRGDPLTTLLPSGQVLIAGGMYDNIPTGSAELYQPATLTPPNLVSIAVAPANPSITAGVSQRFTATGTFSDNSTQTLASAAWSSSANGVATVTSDVSNFGTAFGVAQGSAIVSACTGTICGTTTLTVGAQTPLPPVVDGLAPGSAMVGSWVAISGENFGATQGSSTVTFGGTAATIVSWSDTAIFATVPGGLTSGQTVPVVVTTTAGASNPADFLPITTAAAYRVSPQEVNLLVGQTRTISVMDSSGNALTGLEWDISNPSVATLSTDDPPIITAVAPGTAVVYVVGMPILVTVYSGTSLPAGAPIWSVPFNVSGGPGSMAPAVPSSSGVDLFAIDKGGADEVGSLSALRSDGSTAWSVPIYLAPWTQMVPDFTGNALLVTPYWYTDAQVNHWTHQVQKVDPSTHQLSPLYTFTEHATYYSDNEAQHIVVPHPGGRLFILDQPFRQPEYGFWGCTNPAWGEDDQCHAHVTLVDPTSGQQVATVALEASTGTYPPSPTSVGGMIVAGDGNAYVPYAYTELQSSSIITHARLLRLAPDGTNAEINLGDWTRQWTCDQDGNHCSYSGTGPSVGTVITNAGTGVAVFEEIGGFCADSYENNGEVSYQNCSNSQLQITYVSSSGTPSTVNTGLSWGVTPGTNVPLNSFTPTLQREDGSYIGADSYGILYAIGTDGSTVWQQQVTSASGGGNPPPVFPLYATADGGAIVTTTWPCSGNIAVNFPESAPAQCNTTLGTLYAVDQNGNVTSQSPDTGAVYSWTGNWYDPPQGAGTIAQDNFPPPNVDTASYQSQSKGNPAENLVSAPLCPCEVESEGTGNGDGDTSSPGTNNTVDLILVGDPGRNNGPGRNWNVGNLFDLSGLTAQANLMAVGDSVFNDRVTYVSGANLSVSASLTTNGIITGQVIYFGHGGRTIINGTSYRALFVGQDPVPNENLTALNVNGLLNTMLGPGVTITLNTCDGAWGGANSIAQVIANQLHRKVYAYDVGMFFSNDPNATAPNGNPSGNVPMYMRPWGGKKKVEFDPH